MEENKPTPKQHRAGFVNIIGNPNVGKSTLMNALVGENLSIVTAKAQTTRHRIMASSTAKTGRSSSPTRPAFSSRATPCSRACSTSSTWPSATPT